MPVAAGGTSNLKSNAATRTTAKTTTKTTPGSNLSTKTGAGYKSPGAGGDSSRVGISTPKASGSPVNNPSGISNSSSRVVRAPQVSPTRDPYALLRDHLSSRVSIDTRRLAKDPTNFKRVQSEPDRRFNVGVIDTPRLSADPANFNRRPSVKPGTTKGLGFQNIIPPAMVPQKGETLTPSKPGNTTDIALRPGVKIIQQPRTKDDSLFTEIPRPEAPLPTAQRAAQVINDMIHRSRGTTSVPAPQVAPDVTFGPETPPGPEDHQRGPVMDPTAKLKSVVDQWRQAQKINNLTHRGVVGVTSPPEAVPDDSAPAISNKPIDIRPKARNDATDIGDEMMNIINERIKGRSDGGNYGNSTGPVALASAGQPAVPVPTPTPTPAFQVPEQNQALLQSYLAQLRQILGVA